MDNLVEVGIVLFNLTKQKAIDKKLLEKEGGQK